MTSNWLASTSSSIKSPNQPSFHPAYHQAPFAVMSTIGVEMSPASRDKLLTWVEDMARHRPFTQ